MIARGDRETLLALPAFQRFLFDLVQMGGVFDVPAPGADRNFLDGRRSIALDVLRAFEEVQAARHDSGIPVFTSIQLLGEAMQSAVRNKPAGRADPYAEIQVSDDE